ncbi:MAG: hypothetical protein MI974_11895 [Chitinophagales bacterium]|nr:hypothetical protein [Chitinophagales bacterium]
MKAKNWIQLILLVFLLGSGVIISLREKRLLEKCSYEEMALVVKKYKKKKGGYYVRYKYEVNGKDYYSSDRLTDKASVKHVGAGQEISITVSCSTPSVSAINYDSLAKHLERFNY